MSPEKPTAPEPITGTVTTTQGGVSPEHDLAMKQYRRRKNAATRFDMVAVKQAVRAGLSAAELQARFPSASLATIYRWIKLFP